MRFTDPNADEWWSHRSDDEKTVYRGVLEIAKDLLDGEVLKLSFSDHASTPVRISKRTPTTPGRMAGKTIPGQSDDQWWASLSPAEKTLTHVLANHMTALRSDPDKTLEMTNTDKEFRATLVLNLKKPTGGQAATN